MARIQRLQRKKIERNQFFALAMRLTASSNVYERQRIKKELARITFGE